jgi:hypothetical protein
MTSINLMLAIKSTYRFIKLHPKETIHVALYFYLFHSLLSIPLYPFLIKFNQIEDPSSMREMFLQLFSQTNVLLYFSIILLISILLSILIHIYYIKLSLAFFLKSFEIQTLQLIKSALYLIPVIFIANIIYATISFFGLLLFILPGIIIILTFYFYEYFIIQGQPNIFKAFSDSRQITRGYRMQLLGIIVLFAIISYAISAILDAILGQFMLTFFSISALINGLTGLFYAVAMSHIFVQLTNINSFDILNQANDPDIFSS